MMKLITMASLALFVTAPTQEQEPICARITVEGGSFALRPIPCPTPTATPVPAARIVLSPSEFEVRVGQSVTVTATITDAAGQAISNPAIIWLPTPEAQLHLAHGIQVTPQPEILRATVTGVQPGQWGVSAALAIGNNLALAVHPVIVTVLPAITQSLEVTKESSVVVPMVVTCTGADCWVSGAEAEQGSITFSFWSDTASYTVWCRVLALSPSQDSFYVSIDGAGEDIFDIAEGRWSSSWQWTRLNARAGGGPLAVDPRILSLTAGHHRITFRAREAGAALQQIIITSDPQFVP